MRADKSTPNIAIVAVDIRSDSTLYRQFRTMSVQDKSKALAKAYESIAEAFERKDPNTLVVCVSRENSITSPTTKFVSIDEKKVFLDTMKAVSAKHPNLLLEPGTMSSFRIFPGIPPQRIWDSMLKNYEELEKSYPNLNHTEIQDAKNKILTMKQAQANMKQTRILRNVSFAFYKGKILWKRCKNFPSQETSERKQDVSDLYFHPGRADNMCHTLMHGAMPFYYGKEICTEHGHQRLQRATKDRPYFQLIMSHSISSYVTAFSATIVVHVDSANAPVFVCTQPYGDQGITFFQLNLLDNLDKDAKFSLTGPIEPSNPFMHYFDTASTLAKAARLSDILVHMCNSYDNAYISQWVNQQRKSDHKTALHVAIDSGAPEELIKMLLVHGANPNIKDKNEMTALNYAFFHKDVGDIVSLLRDDHNAVATLPTNMLQFLRSSDSKHWIYACLLLMMADKADKQIEKLAKAVSADDLKKLSKAYLACAKKSPWKFANDWKQLENRENAIGELFYLAYPHLHPPSQFVLPKFSFVGNPAKTKQDSAPSSGMLVRTDEKKWLADLKRELEPLFKQDLKYRPGF